MAWLCSQLEDVHDALTLEVADSTVPALQSGPVPRRPALSPDFGQQLLRAVSKTRVGLEKRIRDIDASVETPRRRIKHVLENYTLQARLARLCHHDQCITAVNAAQPAHCIRCGVVVLVVAAAVFSFFLVFFLELRSAKLIGVA